MLDVRMLFSCLVDADFLDTEAHFNGDAEGKRFRQASPPLNAEAAEAALNRFLSKTVRTVSTAATGVREAREHLWDAVTDAAQHPVGAFTLTAPTGSGKTLAMLRFALEHARRHGLRRIVLAVPFLTVIEQTARIYRTVFSDFHSHYVLEHHSLAGQGEESSRQDAEGDEARQRRLIAENWDAPIILTTNVQLLESLFSNRPSACRKLHRLRESVILFDEAQSLPAHLAVPTLAALSRLSESHGASIVFATATQPAFDTLHEAVKSHALCGWQPREIVPDTSALFALMPRRVEYEWRMRTGKTAWTDLAGELRDDACRQVLVVCNLKRHALALLDALAGVEGVFHLSTNLCAAHRRVVLDRVRERLATGQPCRLISTQCVEAGVDIDFPLVYRAFAPLEAIAQTAGRCNREGRLPTPGHVVVFEPDEKGDWRRRYPTFAYYQAAEVVRTLLIEGDALDLNDPEVFRRYYRSLYDVSKPDAQALKLTEALNAIDLARTAREYRLIEQNTFQLLVPWADRYDEFKALCDEADRTGINGDWMRRAQTLSVSVYRKADGPPAWAIPARLKRYRAGNAGVSEEWFILEGDYYDDTLGLMPPEGPQLFIA
ncbi:MAG: DEAD/DEAH box helicase family protein [Lysobacteraceae bacterium]